MVEINTKISSESKNSNNEETLETEADDTKDNADVITDKDCNEKQEDDQPINLLSDNQDDIDTDQLGKDLEKYTNELKKFDDDLKDKKVEKDAQDKESNENDKTKIETNESNESKNESPQEIKETKKEESDDKVNETETVEKKAEQKDKVKVISKRNRKTLSNIPIDNPTITNIRNTGGLPPAVLQSLLSGQGGGGGMDLTNIPAISRIISGINDQKNGINMSTGIDEQSGFGKLGGLFGRKQSQKNERVFQLPEPKFEQNPFEAYQMEMSKK